MPTRTTEQERIEALIFYGFVLLLAYLVYRLFDPFIVPLCWAAVIVVCCHPWHASLEQRWGRARAAAASTALVTVALIVPVLFLTSAFISEAAQAIAGLDQALDAGALVRVQRGADWVQRQLLGQDPVSLQKLAQQGAAAFAGFIAAQAGTLVRNVALFLFDLIVTLFAVYFLFRDGNRVMRMIRRALPFDERERERIISETHALISASVTAGLIVAAVQGGIGGTVFFALGLGSAVFWGVVMGFFALLPFGGAWVVWLPAALWLLATGSIGRGITLLILGGLIISGVDNILRPLLLSGRAQLNGLLVFVGVLGGALVFGLLGIVLGPVLIAIAVGLFEAYTEPSDKIISRSGRA